MTVLLHSESAAPERDVLVFGTGAIGGAIVRRLRRVRAFSAHNVVVPWTEPSARLAALDELHRTLAPRARQRPLSVVWAAGKAGFSATEEQTAGEFAAYRDVVELFRRINDGADHPHSFHMISSAGGLFEGCSVRSPSQAPAPTRSYGHLKLAQEEHGLGALSAEAISIYRPSSVYALPGQGERLGLIGVLVGNGIAQRTTTIVGALETLRDYVMASDIGIYVADRALGTVAGHGSVHMLVAGHPASILQVITAVEAVIRRRVYIRIADAWNAQNITFAPAVRAPGFTTAPLRVGIELVHAASLGQPLAG